MPIYSDMLNNFKPRGNDVEVEVPVLYLGAEIRQGKDGSYNHQFVLVPNPRDVKGGVVVIKNDSQLNLKDYGIYIIKALSKTFKPDNHFGITIYWLHSVKEIKKMGTLEESQDG